MKRLIFGQALIQKTVTQLIRMNALNMASSKLFFGTKSVILADLGEGTKEATIKQWFVKTG